MITKMHIENFRCFKEFDAELGPFNVLIGPNGSGKSTFLQAVGVLPDSMKRREAPGSSSPGFGSGFGDYYLWKTGQRCSIEIDLAGIDGVEKVDVMIIGNQESGFSVGERRMVEGSSVMATLPLEILEKVSRLSTPVFSLDLSPEALKETSELSEENLLSRSGRGLPLLLNTIHGQDREAFLGIEDAFCQNFPEYKRVLTWPQAIGKEGRVGLALFFKTSRGRDLPAVVASDGAVRFLAYLALKFTPVPPKILLLEEPENGVHYQRLKEIIDILRKLQKEKGTQVIMTTHSPYLLDLVEPNEVLVFEKDLEGAAHCKRLSEFGDVEKLKGYFGTGEIWTEFPEKDIVFGKGKDAGK